MRTAPLFNTQFEFTDMDGWLDGSHGEMLLHQTRSKEIEPDQHLEETTVLDFGENALGPYKTPTTDLSTPIIIPIHPYEY
jgi:hypothetical protein